jgi:mono/diheme cytochrome c family protein
MRYRLLMLLACWIGLLPSLGYAQMGMMQGRGMGGGSILRHQFVMRNGIDPQYASKQSPIGPSADSLAAGKKLYDQNCASCHGASGLGDGPAAKGMEPRPADIAAFVRTPLATDSYLYWTIAEGGVPIGTAMPPFKSSLKEDEIWKIIVYIRRL